MAANVIAVCNSKGGCGKTTVALHLAHGLSMISSVLLVDADPQGSARDWAAQREEPLFPVIGMDRPTLAADLPAVSTGFDYVVIDVGARLEAVMASAIKAADLILIPVQPSPLDLWAVAGLVETIKARQTVTDGLPVAAFVLNRVKSNTVIGREAKTVIHEYGLPVVSGCIHDRTVFARSLASGTTALEVGDGYAMGEMDHIVKQVLETFK